MDTILTVAIVVSFLYACLCVGSFLYDWVSGRNLSWVAQSTDDTGE